MEIFNITNSYFKKNNLLLYFIFLAVGTINTNISYPNNPNFEISTAIYSGNKHNKKLKFDTSSKKKPICNFYVNGACNKGKECPFSHEAQLIRKNELCKYFLTNACVKGDECVYSHDTKSFPCKFFHAVGYCEKGESCRYLKIFKKIIILSTLI